MAITIKINSIDRTANIDARSLSIVDELGSANTASFEFICNDVSDAPVTGQDILIEEGSNKLFAGRVLSKDETFYPPNQLKYRVECIDYSRDLNKKLVVESYLDELSGNIIKDIIDKYTSGITYTNVADGLTITRIAFDYITVAEAIQQIADASGYYWYVDYDKDLHFFAKTDKPASFQLDDDQDYYKELIINTDISQLRNRVYVKSSKYETSDFTEKFIADGVVEEWEITYEPNPLPQPTAKLNDVAKTVGWDGVDNPAEYDFMLNATTKILTPGTSTTISADDEIIISYGADEPIMIKWDDEESIEAVKAIEGGDGIFEHCIVNNNIDSKDWAIDVAKADLLENANPVIQGTFITNQSDVRSGQIITLDSVKRGITEDFLIQQVELARVDAFPLPGSANKPYKPAASATIGYKPAASAEIPYKPPVDAGSVVYYVYEVTIATKLKGLEDLLKALLYKTNESIKRDTEAPETPSGLSLSTGIGELTQATLSWLKASWDANTEDDLSHYELKYKRTAYSDFGYVTTTNTSFLWTGLEQNVEYEVYIRAVDIFGNRSEWSSQQTQTTATDEEIPAQVTGATATAILSGIKVEWNSVSDNNLAGYIVERQESDNGTTWTAAWVEIVRTEATMWLDLFLTYTKFYRYRITAVTRTGTEGSTSTPTDDSIAPNKAGTNDIVADAITADLIAADAVLANNIKAGEIDTDHLAAGAITAAKIEADAVTADKIDVSSLSAITATLGTVHSGNIYGTRFYVGKGTSEDVYFSDSGIHMYDYTAIATGIGFKYGTSTMFYNLQYSSSTVAQTIKCGSYYITLSISSSSLVIPTLLTNRNEFGIVPGGEWFIFRGDGALVLPDVSSNPASLGSNKGGLCSVNGVLKFWNGSAWVNV